MSKIVTNKRQMARLVELMEENLDIARGIIGKAAAQKRWEWFSLELNNLGPPERHLDKWQRVWSDLKVKVKKKMKKNMDSIKKTDGEPNNQQRFTDFEEAVISILQLRNWCNPAEQELGLDNEEISVVEAEPIQNTLTAINDSSAINNRIETGLYSLKSRKRKTKEREKLLTQQTKNQSEFYEKMLSSLNDIQKSLTDIGTTIKEVLLEQKKNNNDILELKKKKLELNHNNFNHY